MKDFISERWGWPPYCGVVPELFSRCLSSVLEEISRKDDRSQFPSNTSKRSRLWCLVRPRRSRPAVGDVIVIKTTSDRRLIDDAEVDPDVWSCARMNLNENVIENTRTYQATEAH